MGRLAPLQWEQRKLCPTCGRKIAYLPLGRYCLVCGYLWKQKIVAIVKALT